MEVPVASSSIRCSELSRNKLPRYRPKNKYNMPSSELDRRSVGIDTLVESVLTS